SLSSVSSSSVVASEFLKFSLRNFVCSLKESRNQCYVVRERTTLSHSLSPLCFVSEKRGSRFGRDQMTRMSSGIY
ncbi:unnamed protein product, partial [Musa acuminata var. zebrina]